MGPGAAVLSGDVDHPSAEAVPSDAALAANGDARAFERLYHAHVGRVMALVRRMAGGAGSDEITQDVFVRAWQKLRTFRGESTFATWLHRVAVNVVLERRRTLATHHGRFADDPLAVERAQGHSGPPDLPMDFERALEQLPPGAREVFVLHDIEGHKHREIGGMLGIAAGTSKTQLHRARMILRRHLGPTGGSSS